MARTTTTTSKGTSTNRARRAASWGNTRYTNITAASRITLAARNANAVISTGTIQIGLIRDPQSLESIASCVGPIGSPGCGTFLCRMSVSIGKQIVADRGARRNRRRRFVILSAGAEAPTQILAEIDRGAFQPRERLRSGSVDGGGSEVTGE